MVNVLHSSDLVMVPVPVALYGAVLRFVAESLVSGERGGRSETAGPAPDEPDQRGAAQARRGGWAAADYAAIVPFLNTFSRAVLGLCSQRAGQWVAYHEAVSASGVASASARSQLGGLTKLVKRIFPEDVERGWPFECEVTPGSDRQLRFRMSVEASRLWAESRQQEQHA